MSNGQYTDEKCSILLLSREMKIKTITTMKKKHYIPTRMAEIKKTSKDVEEQQQLW